jgi:hypothetical protein
MKKKEEKEAETPEEQAPENRNPAPDPKGRAALARAIVNLEREYVRLDSALEGLAARLREVESSLQKVLAENGLDKRKRELYEILLTQNELIDLMTEERFSAWRNRFPAERLF